MKTPLFCLGLAVLGLIPCRAASGPVPAGKTVEAGKVLALLQDGSPEAVAAALRAFLVDAVPPTLYEARPGWGRQAEVPAGVKWKGKAIGSRFLYFRTVNQCQ
jgi:hypothetical protein